MDGNLTIAPHVGARTFLSAAACNVKGAAQLSRALGRSSVAADRNVRAPFGCGFAALRLLPLCATLVCVLSGCGKKPDVNTQAAELEKAFPAAAAAVQAQAQQPAAGQAPATTVADGYVKAALSAVRAKDYASGVVALQTAQHLPGVTADQLKALERAKQAMTAAQ